MPTTYSVLNNLNSTTSCNLTINPWCGQFGARQVFEVIYLMLVSVIGTFGNLLVISSIIYKKRLHKHGNIFIVNLAVADVIVTGIHIPTVIANVFKGDRALPEPLCMAVGYIVTITCVCSVCNLTFIALNRYWAVVHAKTYDSRFSKRNTYLMVGFIWLWSNLLVTPTLYGWSGLGYDHKMLQCAWDDCASLAYNIILMIFAIFCPLCIITWCYVTLFKNVRKRGSTIRRITTSTSSAKPNSNQRILRREVNLLKTLATAVVLFVICWVPYGVCILFFTGRTPPDVKKTVGWLGLSNSAINFVIYGVMNRVFRRGYRDFLVYLFCCGCCKSKSIIAATFPAFSIRASNIKKKNSLFNTNSQNSSQSTPSMKKKMALNDEKSFSKRESTPPSSIKYSTK